MTADTASIFTPPNRCPVNKTHAPAIGCLALDMKTPCPVCGKRVQLTKRGLFQHHLRPASAPPRVSVDRATIERVIEAMEHARYRNHDFAPYACAGCGLMSASALADLRKAVEGAR